jgi:hypothetical protein
MGLKKRRLALSGAASQLITATKDGSSGNHASSTMKASPRLFQARHEAGERTERNPKQARELSVPLTPQIILHLFENRLQPSAANTQSHTCSQDVNHEQMQEPRDHGAVAVVAFWVIGG